jgi:hypothetical protein
VAFGDKTFGFGFPGDTEQRRESGDTEENPDCKLMLLRTAQRITVEASFTSNKIYYLQNFDPVWAKRKENQLCIFERKVLRTIFGPKQENGVYRE